MILVLTGQEAEELQNFIVRLRINGQDVVTALPQDDAQMLLRSENIDTVLAYDHDLPLVQGLIRRHPMLNYALISSKAPDVFHEMTEGYGIFMQLPSPPGIDDADAMLARLAHLHGLVSKPEKGGKK